MRYLTLKLIVLLCLMILACNGQERYYKISWDLNKDGIVYDYILFVAEVDSVGANPFDDSLFTYPDSQWAQFLIGYLVHDTLLAVDTSRGFVEYMPGTVNSGELNYLCVALFARSSQGYYSDRSTAIVQIQPFVRPKNVSGLLIEEKKRWK